MPPIGETLREARLRQGIEIAEVEQATKIRAKYLRALEGEEFDRLPGATFVRQFLRTYADYLGLDSQLLVEEFRVRHEAPGMEDIQQLTPPASPRSSGREGRRRGQGGGGGRLGWGAAAVGALAALLALLLVVGLVAGGDEEGDDPGRSPDAENRRGGADGRNRSEREGRGSGDRSSDRSGRVRITVTPDAETYVCVESGEGEELFEAIISGPETF
ncbi:MAG TPA: helix-turn-helix domain-containing protein, partial [Thermoleophilaceae bacterium]|nr:helix-turn-helix domain-containing protein [Thermoleophilaceae bacterium]